MLNAMPYRHFIIACQHDSYEALSHALRGEQSPSWQARNAAERAFLRSGVRSRSGERVTGLHGLTASYTGSRSTQGHCRADCRARYLRKTSRKRETTGGSSTNRSPLEMLGGVLMVVRVCLCGGFGTFHSMQTVQNARHLQSTPGHSVRHPLTSGLAIP